MKRTVLSLVVSCFTLIPLIAQNVIKVAPDQGVEVNALPKAINENGDGIYELERGGIYYLEARYTFSNEVTIRAEEGDGPLPMIQPIPDELGVLPADMLRFNKSVTFENIYFCGKAEITGVVLERLFRLDESGITLRFEDCFVEYCQNFCIRLDNVNNKVYINNSTFRNLALTSDPANGRLIDTRGNWQDVISITNSTIYNNTAHMLRFDNSISNYVELKNNTIYNVGYHFQVNYAMETLIENNIFANMGWKAGYDPEAPGAFWDIRIFDGDDTHNPDDMKVTIRNNNVYTDEEIDALYVKYPGNIKRINYLNNAGQLLLEAGQVVYENNIEERLTFDNPSPLPMEYIDKFFEVLNTGMAPWADIPFYVDEDGEPGFTNGETYTFNYPSTAKSAAASTTGGPLGSPQWKIVVPSGIDKTEDKNKLYTAYYNGNGTLIVNIDAEINNRAKVYVYNSVGNCLLVENVITGMNQINVTPLESGVYFYQIKVGNTLADSGKLAIIKR